MKINLEDLIYLGCAVLIISLMFCGDITILLLEYHTLKMPQGYTLMSNGYYYKVRCPDGRITVEYDKYSAILLAHRDYKCKEEEIKKQQPYFELDK